MSALGLRLAGLGAVALAVLAVLYLVVWKPAHDRQAAANAHAGQAVATGQAAAAHDALDIVVNTNQQETEADAQTRANDRAIRGAPGASASIDPGLDDAGRRALCLRRAYRGSAACQRLLVPGS
jgi:hypothetical protein